MERLVPRVVGHGDAHGHLGSELGALGEVHGTARGIGDMGLDHDVGAFQLLQRYLEGAHAVGVGGEVDALVDLELDKVRAAAPGRHHPGVGHLLGHHGLVVVHLPPVVHGLVVVHAPSVVAASRLASGPPYGELHVAVGGRFAEVVAQGDIALDHVAMIVALVLLVQLHLADQLLLLEELHLDLLSSAPVHIEPVGLLVDVHGEGDLAVVDAVLVAGQGLFEDGEPPVAAERDLDLLGDGEHALARPLPGVAPEEHCLARIVDGPVGGESDVGPGRG